MADVILTVEERLSDLSDVLTGNVIGEDDVSLELRKQLFGNVSPKVFRDENYIILTVLYNFKDIMLTPDIEFMRMYLMRNKGFIKESTDFIDIHAYDNDNEDELLSYIGGVLKHYDRLKHTVEKIDQSGYLLALEKYKSEWSAFEIDAAYTKARMILYDGIQYGHKFWQGYDDSVAFIKKRSADIEGVLSHTTGDGFVSDKDVSAKDDTELKPKKIGDFGLINELNEHLKGYFTGTFYNIMAPTKGGKSKFTSRAAHNIVVEHGNNLSVWAHEGGYKAWWAQMRAIHYEYLYIRNAEPGKIVAPLSQENILYGDYPSDEVRELEAISHLDLVENPNYGKFNFIDRPFEVETFIEDIETSVQMNNSVGVLIDYLQLIGWKTRGMQKNQAIGKAYQDLLAYIKKRNILAISPSQFTQSFMDELAHSKGDATVETRTGGGESAEIVRTPDINIALYATIDDLQRGEMTVLSVPSRLVRPFPSFRMYADLCTCLFSSMEV